MIAVRVRDPHEQTLPDVGLITVEDNETGEVLSIDTRRKKTRERFAELARRRGAEVEHVLRRANVETVALDTARPYVPVLLQLFSNREKRLR